MNNDLISRSALLEEIDKISRYNDGTFKWLLLSPVYSVINDAPAVEFDESVIQEVLNKRCMTAVANEYLIALHGNRPQGEWINHRNDYGHNIADCSLCGKAMQWHDEDEDGIPRYCWYCGAKMKEGAE